MDQLLFTLAVLVCPIGMGAMMFLMMRGGRSGTDLREREIEQMRAEIGRPKADRHSEPTF